MLACEHLRLGVHVDLFAQELRRLQQVVGPLMRGQGGPRGEGALSLAHGTVNLFGVAQRRPPHGFAGAGRVAHSFNIRADRLPADQHGRDQSRLQVDCRHQNPPSR